MSDESQLISARETDAEDEVVDLDFERRFLCADGDCLGVVTADGRCGACGRPLAAVDIIAFEAAWGTSLDPQLRQASLTLAEDDEKNAVVAAPVVAAMAAAMAPVSDDLDSPEDAAFDLNDRVLCVDDTCVGVIGINGRCGTCGRYGSNPGAMLDRS